MMTSASVSTSTQSDAEAPMPWRLMVLAPAGELVPPEATLRGPVQHHDRQEPHRNLPPLPFVAFWCERLAGSSAQPELD
jgi:hypothetical protein